jgi:putative copper export protein
MTVLWIILGVVGWLAVGTVVVGVLVALEHTHEIDKLFNDAYDCVLVMFCVFFWPIVAVMLGVATIGRTLGAAIDRRAARKPEREPEWEESEP